MTQNPYSVSPLIPACPKSGVTSPAFRPALHGDTFSQVSASRASGTARRFACARVHVAATCPFPSSLCLCAFVCEMPYSSAIGSRPIQPPPTLTKPAIIAAFYILSIFQFAGENSRFFCFFLTQHSALFPPLNLKPQT